MVYIVGAGPGAEDLITVRGQKLLQKADLVIYAGSLVNLELLKETKSGCRILDSAKMTLEEVVEEIVQAEEKGCSIVRLHTGDPCIYGAIREQMDELEARNIPYQICPGVSSFCGAAAALKMEYTLPEVSQSVVITRMQGRTAVPEKESIRSFAAHQATMVIFLSAGMLKELVRELLEGGYTAKTPAAIVYKATWHEEKAVLCSLEELAEAGEREGITKTALIIVGEAVAQKGYLRSKLYDPGFTTEFRRGTDSVPFGNFELPLAVNPKEKKAVLYIVGIGPGSREMMTVEALEALEHCAVIAGYTVYIDLVKGWLGEKEYLVTPMRQERERCMLALACAAEGKETAMICSGDSGVYGMAGLILELLPQYPNVKIRIIPGVTAALSGGAVLGAPLAHDFAVISLSDCLTPMEKIKKRLRAAAAADFVICLYNPSSKRRQGYLRMACAVMLESLPPQTVCGIVKNIGRNGQSMEILSLEELAGKEVDMFTTVFIGNTQTRQIGNYMVTPRGYF